jgi:aerobic carbon-monoxide dehydrogenase large subunit
MANEAYRAVFLRVHPTGKMVLSLTTEPDGHEGDYARQVAGEFGIPALDVKVVTSDHDRFGEGHGFNTSPSDGTSAAVAAATEKILAKARLLAGMALDAPPDALHWGDGVFTAGEDADHARSIADVAMYAHGTGALPPGVEGGLDAQTVYRD